MTEMVQTYRLIFIIGAVLAGVFLILAAILFFALRIPAVIGNLSGATARKAIRNIREGTVNSGEGKHGEGAVTGELSKTPRHREKKEAAPPREKASAHKSRQTRRAAEETSLLNGGDETVMLRGGGETTVLDGETTVLQSGGETELLSGETTILRDEGETVLLRPEDQTHLTGPAGETTVLDQGGWTQSQNAWGAAPAGTDPEPGTQAVSGDFYVEFDITYIHTDERIR